MKRVINSNKIYCSDLKRVNDKTYVKELTIYLNIRQVQRDAVNFNAGQWKWDLSDGEKFIEDGIYGWDTPEAAEEDFYFRHPEFKYLNM